MRTHAALLLFWLFAPPVQAGQKKAQKLQLPRAIQCLVAVPEKERPRNQVFQAAARSKFPAYQVKRRQLVKRSFSPLPARENTWGVFATPNETGLRLYNGQGERMISMRLKDATRPAGQKTRKRRVRAEYTYPGKKDLAQSQAYCDLSF